MSSTPYSQLPQILIANYDYQAITEKELSFEKGDKFELLDNRNSDWWFVSKDANKGYIPSNYVSIFQNHVEKDQNSSGYESEVDSEAEGTIDGEDQVEEVIDSIRRKQSQSRRTFMVDFPNAFDLDEFPNMPMGFRPSTLGNCLDNGIGLASHHLVPELSSNGLGFKDLYLESKTKVRRRQVKSNLCISIVSATDIPFPTGLSILWRCIHVSLMDNTNVISNIHTIAATLVGNKWYFNEKINLFQTDKENQFFVRTSNQSVKLNLLFEICLIVRNPNSSNLVKICCGWAMLPIYKPTGESIDSKPYKLQLLAGTPFENNISLARPPIKNPFRADFNSALPKLELKVWKPNSRFLSNLKYFWLTKSIARYFHIQVGLC